MNIPLGLFYHKIKRNGVFLMFLMITAFGMGGLVEGTETPTDNSKKTETTSKPSKTRKKSSSSNNKGKEAIAGTLDFHTKMLLVSVSIFMLVLVIVLLVIGHFTWFTDIRKKLEEEWEEELKAEEEKRVAKSILSEMINPFEDEEMANIGFDDRRISVDSAGCTRGRCVPPHHSILCPNNPNVPSLNEPFPFNLSKPDRRFDIDPIDYRNRPSTEWMNLETTVKISEPMPVRDRTGSRFYIGNNLSTGFLGRKPPVLPATPDPDNSDTEMGMVIASPQSNYSISKLDML